MKRLVQIAIEISSKEFAIFCFSDAMIVKFDVDLYLRYIYSS